MPNDNRIFINNCINTLFELSEKLYAVKSDLNAIQDEMQKLAVFVRARLKEPSYVKKNALIVRHINAGIISGLSLHESMLKTADELKEPLIRCQSVYIADKNHKKQMEKYALLYTVRTLEKAKIPKEKIAKITGYSVKYLYALKNKEFQKTN